jgi:hypothetical protein
MTDQRRTPPIVPIVASVVWGVLFFAGLFMAMMSPMMFDAPGSEKNGHVIVMFVSVLAFPILCLVSILATWLTWRFTRDAVIAGRRLLPLVAALLPVLSIIGFTIAAILQGDKSFNQ